MSIAQYGKQFPILLRMSNPRGHVELLETIGKGNYGYVYKGKMLRKNNELAAVKVVFLKEDEIKETLLEMEILQSCDHPNITKYLGCFLKSLDFWICMEYCGAGSVDSIYRAFKKPLSEDQIASILYETLLALEYLHLTIALIHRDIKAGNLLLTLNGCVKLADFGVSAQLKSVGARANTFIGTPYWMAPEVIECDPDNPKGMGKSYDDKSDIWSIGITAIEIAEKSPPLSDIHPMQALTMIAKTDMGFAKPKNFSKPFVNFVNCCLVKNPEKRPSATEILKNPFMEHAASLNRPEILMTLVSTFMKIKEKKAAGQDVTEDDELPAFVDKQPPAVKTVAETLMKAKTVISSLQTSVSQDSISPKVKKAITPPATLDDISAAPPISDFPPVVNNVQEGIVPIFEPIMLTSVAELMTSDFLDGQYILIGNDHGLFYLDIKNPTMKTPAPIFVGIRFRQISVMPKYNVLIALSGKHDHLRQYSLSSIRKLLLHYEGHTIQNLARSDTSVPIQNVSFSNDKPEDEYEYLKAKEVLSDSTLLDRWSSDFIKIVNTKDTKHFFIEETESTAYLVMQGQGITVFRWATSPYDKFMKIKSFWVPETPKFVSLSNDGLAACELFVGYASEMNRVTINDSKVSEIRLQREMKVKSNGKQRWQNMLQIPFTDAKLEKLLRENANVNTTTNRKLSAASGPTLNRAPAANERYFLGTYHRLTKVVDIRASPMVGAGVGGWKDGVMWSEPPVCQILRPLQHVISAGEHNIEIVDWKSAALRQRLTIDPSCSFRILCSHHGHTLLSVDKKKVGSVLYWMRESSTAPRQPGSILSAVKIANEPRNLLDRLQSPVNNGNMPTLKTPVSMESAMEDFSISDRATQQDIEGDAMSIGTVTSENQSELHQQPNHLNNPRGPNPILRPSHLMMPSSGPPPRMYIGDQSPSRPQYRNMGSMPRYDIRFRPNPNYQGPHQQPRPFYSISETGAPVSMHRPPPQQRSRPDGQYQMHPIQQYPRHQNRPIELGDPRIRPRPAYRPRPDYDSISGRSNYSLSPESRFRQVNNTQNPASDPRNRYT